MFRFVTFPSLSPGTTAFLKIMFFFQKFRSGTLQNFLLNMTQNHLGRKGMQPLRNWLVKLEQRSLYEFHTLYMTQISKLTFFNMQAHLLLCFMHYTLVLGVTWERRCSVMGNFQLLYIFYGNILFCKVQCTHFCKHCKRCVVGVISFKNSSKMIMMFTLFEQNI